MAALAAATSSEHLVEEAAELGVGKGEEGEEGDEEPHLDTVCRNAPSNKVELLVLTLREQLHNKESRAKKDRQRILGGSLIEVKLSSS